MPNQASRRPAVKPAQSVLLERCLRVLRQALAGGGEAARKSACELGRSAFTAGSGVLSVTALHHEALRLVLLETPKEDHARVLVVGHAVLLELLSPFETTHRAVRDANLALGRMNELLEAQAQRTAHALHDEAGQLLSSIYLALAELEDGPASEAKACLHRIHALLDQFHGELRRLSHELRPRILDDIGVLAAIGTFASGLSRRTGLPITVVGEARRLPRVAETALYRIVQEALNNAARHAQAKAASVELHVDERQARCSIVDDGQGFEPAALRPGGGSGLGLLGIQARVDALGGELRIQSAPGHGTQLVVTIPLLNQHAHQNPAGR